MKSIKFGSAIYNLVDDVNVHGTRFQATVYKGTASVEQIAENAKSVDIIRVYDGNQLLGEYSGYTTPVAFSLGYVGSDAVVSIEMENTAVVADVSALMTAIDDQSAAISDLADNMSLLEASQSDQDAAIEDIAEAVNGLEH